MMNFITLIVMSSYKNGYSWTMTQNAFFLSLNRFGFISSVITIITIILLKKGLLVKAILTIPSKILWRPLARLTFVAYLIFPLVIGAGHFNTSSQFYINYPNAAVRMLSNVALTYLFSLIIYLFFEKPIENLKNYAHAALFQMQKLKRTGKTKKNNYLKEVDHYELLERDFKLKKL